MSQTTPTEIYVYCQVRLAKWADNSTEPELYFSPTKRMSRHGKAEGFCEREGHFDASAQCWSDRLPLNRDHQRLVFIARR